VIWKRENKTQHTESFAVRTLLKVKTWFSK
jgi:hypothetical protein